MEIHIYSNIQYTTQSSLDDLRGQYAQLMNGPFTDITFVFNQNNQFQTVSAHKSVLALRSPVFAVMFTTPMVESKQSKIYLLDDPFVFKELLHYIYTDTYSKIPDDVSFRQELLAMASKYQVKGLVNTMEIEISTYLTMENCIQLLVFSDTMFASELKRSALQFIAMNYESLSCEESLHALDPSLQCQIEQYKCSVFRKGFFKLNGGNGGDKRTFRFCTIS